jgi:A/G-specific adenine glycosylase
MLREAARVMVRMHHGRVPKKYESLRALPGVGEYTARAVRVFAWNEPEILMETNVRSVFLHECFPRSSAVSDRVLAPYLAAALDTKNPRRWHEALMDYGAFLKRTIPNPSRRGSAYRRTEPFTGSVRYARGKILALALTKTTFSATEALRSAPHARTVTVRAALDALLQEKTIRRIGRSRYALRKT